MLWGVPFQSGISRYLSPGGYSSPLPNTFTMWQSPGVVTIASSNAETALLTGTPAIGALTIPGNYMAAATQIRVIIRGYIQTAVVVPTGQLRVTLGGTQIYTTGAISVATAQIVSPAAFECDLEIGARSIGATGTIAAAGVVWTSSALAVGLSPSTDQTGTVDTRAANAISLLWTWGTSDPANSISVVSASVSIIG